MNEVDANEVDANEIDAFVQELYADHRAALFKYAMYLTARDSQKAEDLVQETILRAWKTFRHKGAPPHIRAWLIAVARNLAYDAYRARQARPQEVGDDVLDLIPDEDQIDRALQSLVVMKALSSLKPDHVAVIVEIYYRRRSVAEAARVLGIPAGTVKSRTYAALAALTEALQEQGVTGVTA